MVTTFDLAMMVIEEETEKISSSYDLCEENINFFKGYCDVIDSLAEESKSLSTSVDIDEETKEIIITVESEQVFIQNEQSKYLALMESSVALSFSQNEEGNLDMIFVFPSVWNKK